MDSASLAVLVILAVLFGGLIYLRLQDSEYHGDALDRFLAHFTDRRSPPSWRSEAVSVVEEFDSGGDEISLGDAEGPSRIGEESSAGSSTAEPRDGSASEVEELSGEFGPAGTPSPPGGAPLPEGDSVASEVQGSGASPTGEAQEPAERAFFDPSTSASLEKREAGDAEDFWQVPEDEAVDSKGDRGDAMADGPLFDEASEGVDAEQILPDESSSPDALASGSVEQARKDPDDTIIGYELSLESTASADEQSGGGAGGEGAESGGTTRAESETPSEGDGETSQRETDPGFGVVDSPGARDDEAESSDTDEDAEGSSILGFEGPRSGPESED